MHDFVAGGLYDHRLWCNGDGVDRLRAKGIPLSIRRFLSDDGVLCGCQHDIGWGQRQVGCGRAAMLVGIACAQSLAGSQGRLPNLLGVAECRQQGQVWEDLQQGRVGIETPHRLLQAAARTIELAFIQLEVAGGAGVEHFIAPHASRVGVSLAGGHAADLDDGRTGVHNAAPCAEAGLAVAKQVLAAHVDLVETVQAGWRDHAPRGAGDGCTALGQRRRIPDLVGQAILRQYIAGTQCAGEDRYFVNHAFAPYIGITNSNLGDGAGKGGCTDWCTGDLHTIHIHIGCGCAVVIHTGHKVPLVVTQVWAAGHYKLPTGQVAALQEQARPSGIGSHLQHIAGFAIVCQVAKDVEPIGHGIAQLHPSLHAKALVGEAQFLAGGYIHCDDLAAHRTGAELQRPPDAPSAAADWATGGTKAAEGAVKLTRAVLIPSRARIFLKT